MGRPKLADLSCTVCHMIFKKKILYEEHMENHLSSENQNKQPRAHLKHYCYTCRKSFDKEEYKLHIQEEHQFDSPKMNNQNSNNELFDCENGFVLLSKRKIKKENESPKQKASSIFEKNKSVDISLADIKIEPPEKINEESDCIEKNISVRKKKINIKIPKIKCSVCGMRCKGERGLKIHMSTHKKSRNTSEDISQSEDEVSEDIKLNQIPMCNEIKSSSTNTNPSLLISNNSVLNLGQNTQPGYILNVPQLQNQSVNNIGNQANSTLNFGNQVSSLLNTANQPNTQVLHSVLSQKIKPPNNLPKFDCSSEKYLKWLKKFVYKCKAQKYPLTSEICQNISHITEDLTEVLANPKGSLKQKSNHFYFMRMHNILSEIMLGHMQHRLCGVSS